MSEINDDTEFQDKIADLSLENQRRLAASFVESVLSLSNDKRIAEVVKKVKAGSSEDEVQPLFREMKRASLEAHARCGAEGDWDEQASYFVARAAQACVEPQVRSTGKNPAWKAAVQCRMARTCLAAESDKDSHHEESLAQYTILNNFLNP